MTDVEALHPQRIDVVDFDAERIDQSACARLL
jgi:hypothetical protein